MDITTLSLVLPVYNSSENLVIVVQECMAIISRYFTDYEIIIVDDGSIDSTFSLANNLAATYPPVMVMHHTHPHGYTRALISGWGAARGNYILLLDIDGPVGITELPRFIPYIGHYDIISGYRFQSRETNTYLYTQLVNGLFNLNLHDHVCHFSLFRHTLLHNLMLEVAPPWNVLGIYARAKRYGATQIQVGVNHRQYTHQTSRGLNTQVKRWSFWELARLWIWLRQAIPTDDMSTPNPTLFWSRKAVLNATLAAIIWGIGIFLRRKSLMRQYSKSN